jgi:hypothetical protein
MNNILHLEQYINDSKSDVFLVVAPQIVVFWVITLSGVTGSQGKQQRAGFTVTTIERTGQPSASPGNFFPTPEKKKKNVLSKDKVILS